MKKICKKCEIVNKNNNVMREQAKRIIELKKEVNDLSVCLEQYRSKEGEITQILSFAKTKAEELVQESKIKYALECQRLKLYRDKWMRYIKDKNKAGKLAQDIEKTNEVLKECQVLLEDMLYTDLGINQSVSQSYINERERIDDEPSLDYNTIIKETEENFYGKEIITDEELGKMLSKLKF